MKSVASWLSCAACVVLPLAVAVLAAVWRFVAICDVTCWYSAGFDCCWLQPGNSVQEGTLPRTIWSSQADSISFEELKAELLEHAANSNPYCELFDMEKGSLLPTSS